MKRIKLLGIAVVALLSLAGILAATGSAATVPNVLPAGTEAAPVTATASSGKTEFGNGFIKVTSSSSTGTQNGNAAKLGAFTNKFKGVKDSLGNACKGATDTEPETVTVSGTFHIRDYKEGSTLRVATIFLLKEVTFTCGSTEVKTKGCVAGALSPESTLTKTLTVKLERNGSTNDNKIITVLNESNEEGEACQLLAKMGAGGSFELSSQVQTSEVTGFKQSGSAVEVLVMPL